MRIRQLTQLRFKAYWRGSTAFLWKDALRHCFCTVILLIKIKKYISSYMTDGTKECHLWHCASRTPNPRSLPDHGFNFQVLNFHHQGESAFKGFVAELVIHIYVYI